MTSDMPSYVWAETHYYAICQTCSARGVKPGLCQWVPSTLGGWWGHKMQAGDDDHKPEVGWEPHTPDPAKTEERIVEIMKQTPLVDDGVGVGLMKYVARDIVKELGL